MTRSTVTRRRTALRAAFVAGAALLLTATGCSDSRSPEEDSPATRDSPTAEDALQSVGIPAPSAELSVSEGIVVSDLDEWSVRVAFSAPPEQIEEWLSASFNGALGLPVTWDGATISQRFAPEEIHEGARFVDGSNPSDPSATYTVLISPEGTDVVIAAARTSR